jgi:hypothetical protein
MRGYFGLLLGLMLAFPPAMAAASDPTKIPPELAKARLDAARKTYELSLKVFRTIGGKVTAEELYLWSCRWRDAQSALTKNKEKQVASAQDHLGRMKHLETIVQTMVRAGLRHSSDASAVEYYRLQAEIELVQAKGR